MVTLLFESALVVVNEVDMSQVYSSVLKRDGLDMLLGHDVKDRDFITRMEDVDVGLEGRECGSSDHSCNVSSLWFLEWDHTLISQSKIDDCELISLP